MALHNDISVWIDGINRTASAVLPLKWGNFLDERLDECHLSLRAIKRSNFSPLTPVEIYNRQQEYFYPWHTNPKIIREQTAVKRFIVADDSATEFRPGSGLYNHDLYLIEVTKVAECVVVDTITFTNDIGRNYTKDAGYAEPRWE